MKEFFVGLIFLLVLAVMAGVGVLLYPFLMLLAFFLRILFVIFLCLFGIWLLGKLIVMIFDETKDRS